jgi:hypothetical protein
MKKIVLALWLVLACNVCWPHPLSAPDLGYVPVPNVFRLPPNANFGAVSGVAINSKGNIFVLSRGRSRSWNSTRADAMSAA